MPIRRSSRLRARRLPIRPLTDRQSEPWSEQPRMEGSQLPRIFRQEAQGRFDVSSWNVRAASSREVDEPFVEQTWIAAKGIRCAFSLVWTHFGNPRSGMVWVSVIETFLASLAYYGVWIPHRSSWAVSTGSVASDRFGIKSKSVVDLASQHLLSCVRHQQGCTGGHLDNAWRYLNKNGWAIIRWPNSSTC